jgi:hypothetical protein
MRVRKGNESACSAELAIDRKMTARQIHHFEGLRQLAVGRNACGDDEDDGEVILGRRSSFIVVSPTEKDISCECRRLRRRLDRSATETPGSELHLGIARCLPPSDSMEEGRFGGHRRAVPSLPFENAEEILVAGRIDV